MVDQLYILDISYTWGVNLVTKLFPYTTLEKAKAEVEKLLPGVVWEDQQSYLVVDLHQFGGPVKVLWPNENHECEIFHISIAWNRLDRPTGFKRAS